MTDRFTVRAVVVMLGTFAIIGLVGLIWLVGKTDVRDAATLAIVAGPTGTALGALGAVLVSTRTIIDEPQRVTVMNPPGDPVPVEEAAPVKPK